MGMRQMTFEIPGEVAERFVSQVPAAEQSNLVANLLQRHVSRPTLTEEQWDAACEAANADETLNADIEEWQAFSDPIEEPWNAPSPR
jgi:hypothetical protein